MLKNYNYQVQLQPALMEKDLARLFLNWLMGDKGQIAMERLYGSKGTLEGIVDQRPYIRDAWYYEPAEIYPVDWARWDKDYHRDMDLWTGILRRGGR